MQKRNKLLIIVSKGTADALYPALILATTAASQNMRVDLYFTFGGMKLITKGMAETIKPSVDLGISQEELTKLLQKGGMPTLQDMLKMARDMGVKIHACSPTMSLFGLTAENLSEGTFDDIIGAATFLEMASDPDTIVLFI
jgi:peroxiredoxin family protein